MKNNQTLAQGNVFSRLVASGAAVATVVAQAASVIISVLRLRGQMHLLPFTITRKDIGFDGAYIKDIPFAGLWRGLWLYRVFPRHRVYHAVH